MQYKVLIKLFVPAIEQEFEMYVPVNKQVLYVAKLLNRVVSDITNQVYPLKDTIHLCNRRSGIIYENKDYVRNTDIRNGSQVIMY